MSDTPNPTEGDHRNARIRQEIADRQNAGYCEARQLARETLGGGWKPWMRLDLIPSDHHQTGETTPVASAFKVHHGELRLSEHSKFIRKMPDGTVRVADNYDELFGELLREPHPTRTLELLHGKIVPAPRWTLVWSAMELYQPKDADTLAKLRASREAGKKRRKQEQFAADNPLLSQAGIKPEDVERGR